VGNIVSVGSESFAGSVGSAKVKHVVTVIVEAGQDLAWWA
jgi:hypothetical protein